MKSKHIKRMTMIVISLVLFMVLLARLNGYSFTQSDAISVTNSKYNNQIIYSKEFGDRKLAIVRGDFEKSIVVIKKKWGILQKVTHTANFTPGITDELNRTWSSSPSANGIHEFALAVEPLDPRAKKVIISNDEMLHTSLDEIKRESTFFVELDVEKGYAVHYAVLEFKGFVFRLLDDKGQIIYTGR